MIKNPIRITDYAKLSIEDNNYVLHYRIKAGKKPNGSEAKSEWKWILGGFFPTAGSALQDFVTNAPVYSPEELKTFKDLVNCIKGAEKRMKELAGD